MASHESRPSNKRRLQIPQNALFDTASSFSSSLSSMVTSSVWNNSSSKVGGPHPSPKPKGVIFKKQLDNDNASHTSLETVKVSDDTDDGRIETTFTMVGPKSTSILPTIYQNQDFYDHVDNAQDTNDYLDRLLVPPQPGNDVVTYQEHKAAMMALNRKWNDTLIKASSKSNHVLMNHKNFAAQIEKELNLRLDEATACVVLTQQKMDELYQDELQVLEEKLDHATQTIIEKDRQMQSLKLFYEERMMDFKLACEDQKSQTMEWSQRTMDEIRQKSNETRLRDLEQARLQHDMDKEKALAVQRVELMQLTDEDKIQLLMEQSDQELMGAVEGAKMECQLEYNARIEAVLLKERERAEDEKNRALQAFKIQLDEERSLAINDAIIKFMEARTTLCHQHKEELHSLSKHHDNSLSQVESEYQDKIVKLKNEHQAELQEMKRHLLEVNEALSNQRDHYEFELAKLSKELHRVYRELEKQKYYWEAEKDRAVHAAVEKAVKISIDNAEREREAAFNDKLQMIHTCRQAYEQEKGVAIKEATDSLEEALHHEREQVHQLKEACDEKVSDIVLLKRKHQEATDSFAKELRHEREQVHRLKEECNKKVSDIALLKRKHQEELQAKDAVIVESRAVAVRLKREATAKLKMMETQATELRLSYEQDTDATVVAACAVIFQGMAAQLDSALTEQAAFFQTQMDEMDAAAFQKNEKLVKESKESQLQHEIICLEYEKKIEMLMQEFDSELASQIRLGEQERAKLQEMIQTQVSDIALLKRKHQDELQSKDAAMVESSATAVRLNREATAKFKLMEIQVSELCFAYERDTEATVVAACAVIFQGMAAQLDSALTEQAAFFQTQMDEMDAAAFQKNEKLVKECKEIRLQHEIMRLEYEKKIEMLVQEFDSELASQIRLGKQERAKLQDMIKTRQKLHDDVLQLANIKSENDIGEIRREHEKVRLEYEEKINTLERQSENDIGEIRREHDKIRLEYEEKINTLERQSENEIGEIRRREHDKIRLECEETIKTLERQSENDIGEIRREHEKVRLEYEGKIETLERQCAFQSEQLGKQSCAKQEELQVGGHERQLRKQSCAEQEDLQVGEQENIRHVEDRRPLEIPPFGRSWVTSFNKGWPIMRVNRNDSSLKVLN